MSTSIDDFIKQMDIGSVISLRKNGSRYTSKSFIVALTTGNPKLIRYIFDDYAPIIVSEFSQLNKIAYDKFLTNLRAHDTILDRLIHIHYSKLKYRVIMHVPEESKCDDITRFHQMCIENDHIGVSDMIMKNKDIVYEKDQNGMTSTFSAYQYGSVDVAKIIRQEIDSHDENTYSFSIHDASGYNLPNVLIMLITFGSDVNELDQYGNTPLFYAIHNHSYDVQNILMKFGACLKKNLH